MGKKTLASHKVRSFEDKEKKLELLIMSSNHVYFYMMFVIFSNEGLS